MFFAFRNPAGGSPLVVSDLTTTDTTGVHLLSMLYAWDSLVLRVLGYKPRLFRCHTDRGLNILQPLSMWANNKTLSDYCCHVVTLLRRQPEHTLTPSDLDMTLISLCYAHIKRTIFDTLTYRQQCPAALRDKVILMCVGAVDATVKSSSVYELDALPVFVQFIFCSPQFLVCPGGHRGTLDQHFSSMFSYGPNARHAEWLTHLPPIPSLAYQASTFPPQSLATVSECQLTGFITPFSQLPNLKLEFTERSRGGNLIHIDCAVQPFNVKFTASAPLTLSSATHTGPFHLMSNPLLYPQASAYLFKEWLRYSVLFAELVQGIQQDKSNNLSEFTNNLRKNMSEKTGQGRHRLDENVSMSIANQRAIIRQFFVDARHLLSRQAESAAVQALSSTEGLADADSWQRVHIPPEWAAIRQRLAAVMAERGML